MSGKVLKSVYFDIALFVKAEEKHLDINAICTEALINAVNDKSALGEELVKSAQLSKDNQILTRLSMKKASPLYKERWARAVTVYAEKYNLTIGEVLNKFS